MKRVFIFLSVILFSSCEECKEIENEKAISFILTAGESVHDSIIYNEYDPIICLKGQRHGTDSEYYYTDSLMIDLNQDGINDLHFRYYQYFVQPDCNCEGIDCCMPFGESSCTVELLSDIELAATEINGLHPDRLHFGDSIDSYLTWIGGPHKYLFDAWGWSESPWNMDYYNSFMGFRCIGQSDTLYGWIRMNTLSANRIEIYDYVIEK